MHITGSTELFQWASELSGVGIGVGGSDKAGSHHSFLRGTHTESLSESLRELPQPAKQRRKLRR